MIFGLLLLIYYQIYHLVMTNSSPWFFDGPNRKRWFTYLKCMVIFHGKPLVITRGYCWYTIICTMIFSDILQHFQLILADGPSGSLSGAAIQLRRPDLALNMIDHEDFMKIQKDAWSKLHFKGETDEIWNAWCNRSRVSRFKIIQASCIVFLILGGPFFVRNFLSNVGFGPEKVALGTCWVPSCCHPVTVIHSDTGLARRCACEESENHGGTGPDHGVPCWSGPVGLSTVGRDLRRSHGERYPCLCGAWNRAQLAVQLSNDINESNEPIPQKNCLQEVKAFD